MICGIYKIECMINGKVYVGQSNNIERRWYKHKWELNNNNHKNIHLQRAFNKYGADNFTWEIIEECEEDELDNREIHYIKKYGSYNREKGYNQTIGGGGIRGHIVSEETRRKLSVANRGENNPNYGKHHSKETKRKISEASTGEKNTMYGRTGEKHPRSRKVLCIETGIIYNSITEASRELNLQCSQNISSVCRGKKKTCGGYHWQYVD